MNRAALARLREQIAEAAAAQAAETTEAVQAATDVTRKLAEIGARSTLDPTALPSRAELFFTMRCFLGTFGEEGRIEGEKARASWAARWPQASFADLVACAFYHESLPPERRGLPGDPAHPNAAITPEEVDAWLASHT